MISLRLLDCDRTDIQAIATRLFVRESDIYRFTINFFLNRFSCLLDPSCTGSDLLLPLCEIRAEINHTLGLKKIQLEKIINGNILDADKYVAMSDVELLLMPQRNLRQRLSKLMEVSTSSVDVEDCLKDYLTKKYNLYPAKILGTYPVIVDAVN